MRVCVYIYTAHMHVYSIHCKKLKKYTCKYQHPKYCILYINRSINGYKCTDNLGYNYDIVYS